MNKSTKIVLKKNKKLNTIWHPESSLVFKSSKDRRVIGTYINKEFINLNNNALHLCKTWGFKYDKELYNTQNSEQEEHKNSEQDIHILTEKFTNSLFNSISDMNNKLKNKTKIIEEQNAELELLKAQLCEMTEKYNNLKCKFEGIKKLFN